jgi:putative membrane protein
MINLLVAFVKYYCAPLTGRASVRHKVSINGDEERMRFARTVTDRNAHGARADVDRHEDLMSHLAHPRRTLSAVLLCTAAAAACSSSGANRSNIRTTAMTQSNEASAEIRSDANVFGALHAANTAEIAAGTLAQQRGTDSAVRAFAAQMVNDHTAMERDRTALESRLMVTRTTPSGALMSVQGEEAEALNKQTSGPEFDRLYVQQQVLDHQRTLDLIDASIAIAQHEDLKKALQSQVRPAVAHHLAEARQLRDRVGRPQNSASSSM